MWHSDFSTRNLNISCVSQRGNWIKMADSSPSKFSLRIVSSSSSSYHKTCASLLIQLNLKRFYCNGTSTAKNPRVVWFWLCCALCVIFFSFSFCWALSGSSWLRFAGHVAIVGCRVVCVNRIITIIIISLSLSRVPLSGLNFIREKASHFHFSHLRSTQSRKKGTHWAAHFYL